MQEWEVRALLERAQPFFSPLPLIPMRSGLAIFLPYGCDVGWLYLAVVLDLFSRRVIGWAMATAQDETLIEAAFRMALVGRHLPAGSLFHSESSSRAFTEPRI